MNPLLRKSNLAFGYPEFDQYKTEHFEPAILQLLEEAKKEIQDIAENPAKPSFENTLQAMEECGEDLGRVSGILFNLNTAETNHELQEVVMKLSPQLAAFQSEIYFNHALFLRVDHVYRNRDKENLSAEQLRLLELRHRAFEKNGAGLEADKQSKLLEINQELAKLSVQFGKNVLQETNDYYLLLTHPEDLTGLPEDAVATAKNEAESRELDGWVFTLQAPSYMPFMKFSMRRDLREKIYRAYGSRACKGNDYDNRALIQRIAQLRQERAEILGFKSHAAFVLKERMAKSPENVLEFLNNLHQKAYPFAQQDMDAVRKFAKEKDHLDELMPWDHAYYCEKLKHAKYEFSEEELKKYFPLSLVLDGIFDIAKRLFALNFKPLDSLPTYAEGVKNFEVSDEKGEHVAVFMADFYPRKGKKQGAWMTSYREQSKLRDKHQSPIISIVCNFSPPQEDGESYLTFNEVLTLHHEFGHALHGILSDVTYGSLSGTNVFWDFVELPSQFMENYARSPQILKQFTRHRDSSESIPDDLMQKLLESAFFMEAYQSCRQLSFGFLDMSWHNGPVQVEDVEAFENQSLNRSKFYPNIPGTCMSASFAHIFQGGYSAGYYSYKWAEVLDADAFEYFKENGIFDAECAAKFKKLLSSGGTKDPMELYTEFRGKKPDPDALLRRAGFHA